jgi:hypothetical protein
VLPPYTKTPHLLPRKLNHVQAGPPVDLSDLQSRPVTSDVLRQATDRIMAAIAQQLAEIRGEPPPAERFDPRRRGLPATGNPAVPGDESRPTGEPE